MDMGLRVLQVSSKELGERSACGKSKQLLGSAAGAAIPPSQGKKEGFSLSPAFSTCSRNPYCLGLGSYFGSWKVPIGP